MMQKIIRVSSIVILATSFLTFRSTPAAELSEIERRGTLIVAVKDNVRPLGFRDAEGNLQGLEIDLARQLAAELLGDENAVVFQSVSNRERLQALSQGKVDLVIARMTATESRSRIVDFSPYYYLDGTGLVTRDPSVETIRDLATQPIAVLRDSSTIAAVQYALPQAQFIGVNSYQEALRLLETGQATAFAGDHSILAGWVQEYPQYRQLPDRLSGEALSVAMPRGLKYASLRQRVNDAITSRRRSGWLQERATYWGLPW